MVKLRLKRMGSINKPLYRIVTLDSRKKRDGAYLESIGYYDPKTDPFTLKVDVDRALYWLGVGAQPSDTVRSLLKKAGPPGIIISCLGTPISNKSNPPIPASFMAISSCFALTVSIFPLRHHQ